MSASILKASRESLWHVRERLCFNCMLGEMYGQGKLETSLFLCQALPIRKTESHNVALPGLELAMQRGWPGNLGTYISVDLAFSLNLSFQPVCKVGSVDVLY